LKKVKVRKGRARKTSNARDVAIGTVPAREA